jgi:hypothetical protein
MTEQETQEFAQMVANVLNLLAEGRLISAKDYVPLLKQWIKTNYPGIELH